MPKRLQSRRSLPQLAVAIAVVVVINGVFAFAQEYRAERAGRRLRELLQARVAVRRDRHRVVIDTTGLVVGDVVLPGAGDQVSADLELLDAHALAVDESTLTGESVPVRPEAGAYVHAGTFVIEGEAEAGVMGTGARTRLAGIAALTRAAGGGPGTRRHRLPLLHRPDEARERPLAGRRRPDGGGGLLLRWRVAVGGTAPLERQPAAAVGGRGPICC